MKFIIYHGGSQIEPYRDFTYPRSLRMMIDLIDQEGFKVYFDENLMKTMTLTKGTMNPNNAFVLVIEDPIDKSEVVITNIYQLCDWFNKSGLRLI